jgi:hypothetical protein
MSIKHRKTRLVAAAICVAFIVALAAGCVVVSPDDTDSDTRPPLLPPTQSPISPGDAPDDSPPPTSPDSAGTPDSNNPASPSQDDTPSPDTTPSVDNLTRTVTLGGFAIVNDDAPDYQKGWCSDNDSGLPSSGSVSDFTGAQYLVVEFDKAPVGGIFFVWVGDSDGAQWNQTDRVVPDLGTTETLLVIELSEMNGYDNYIKCTGFVKIFLGYYSSSWNDLGIKDAYLAVDG